MAYKQGAVVRVSNEFTQSGVAADPTTVKLTVVRPNGLRNTYTYLAPDAVIVKDSTGNYHADLSAIIPGTWTYRWFSEGTGQAADDKTFLVEANLATDAPGPPRGLGTDFFELQRYIGRELRIGRDPGTWQPDERADVADIMRSSLRRFYWHEPVVTSSLQGKDGQFQKLKQTPAAPWSFLEATKPLTLVEGETDYALPDDFGEMLKDGFTYATDQQPVALVSHERILQMRSRQTVNGTPKYASLSAIDATSSRQQVSFYPAPDKDYTVHFTYLISPKELNENNPIPLGGPQHAETIIEACLAACEKFMYGTEGVHEKKYQECLARSIQCDANLSEAIDDPWPLEDAARGLDINKAYLKRLIGSQLEFGPHPATWNFTQASRVDLALQIGLRKMYWPPVLPGEKFAHQWKYLKPVKTITTDTGISNYDLPSGFVRLEGPVTFEPDEGGPSIKIVKEHQIRQMLTRSTSVGRPQYAAVVVKPIDPAGGTHYELVCWPPADDAYELSFRCQLSPFAMAADVSLPYGGQQHAQTLIEACLAAGEEQLGIVNGPHAAKFMECLIASVGSDRQTDCPEYLGYNGDRSGGCSDDDLTDDPPRPYNNSLVEHLGPI